MRPHVRVLAVPLLAAALALTACAPATSGVSGGRLTPLVVGWEQFFKLTWTVGEYRGQPVVSGRERFASATA